MLCISSFLMIIDCFWWNQGDTLQGALMTSVEQYIKGGVGRIQHGLRFLVAAPKKAFFIFLPKLIECQPWKSCWALESLWDPGWNFDWLNFNSKLSLWLIDRDMCLSYQTPLSAKRFPLSNCLLYDRKQAIGLVTADNCFRKEPIR